MHTAELLCWLHCRYYFRVLERQSGSAKYGSYAAVVTGMSYTLQLLLGSLLQAKGAWPPCPLPLVFASFVPFLLDVPATSDFTLLGYKMTDKVSRGGGGGTGLPPNCLPACSAAQLHTQPSLRGVDHDGCVCRAVGRLARVVSEGRGGLLVQS
jgi:hypothetical protein